MLTVRSHYRTEAEVRAWIAGAKFICDNASGFVDADFSKPEQDHIGWYTEAIVYGSYGITQEKP